MPVVQREVIRPFCMFGSEIAELSLVERRNAMKFCPNAGIARG